MTIQLVSAQTYVYVKHDAAGSNDGTSWADAYTSLESALNAATANDRIWVAAGTYTPEKDVGGTGDRFKTFQLKNDVAVYGGFAGNEDPASFNLDYRDFDANETILSGDLGGGVNVYHVFRHVNAGLNNTAILDGFTISGGKADGSDPDNKGGGMLNSGSSAGNGSNPTIRNCVFKNNAAAEGGAMYNSRYSSPVVSHTSFSTNTAATKGGAVFNIRNNPTFSHCTFSGNAVAGSAANDGGGAIYNATSHAAEGAVISNCTFINNSVPTTGTNTYGGGAIFSSLDPGKLEISHSTFTGNTGKYGGAVYHRSGNDTNRDNSDIKITNSTFENNDAAYGGAIFSDRHHSIVTSGIIRGNEATEQAGGFYSRYASSKLINTLLSGNKSSKHGGGAYFNEESPELINTTVSGNYSGERGGGISMIGSSTVAIKNTILWGNASPEGNELWLCATCIANIDHSLYGNATGDFFITEGGVVNATNSLSSDPQFFLPLAATASGTPNTSGVYMIRSSSPAVDAGRNDHLGASVTNDLRGGPRIVDGNKDETATIDIGAYEYNPTCSSNPPISGTGTAADPYIIAEPGNFCWMAQNPADWSKHYRQIVDIDLTGSENLDGGLGLRPIGNSTTRFTGTYDGQNHTISNLTINRPSTNTIGLFGIIDGQSTQKVVLKNIILVNVTINGNREVGALVGLADQFNDIINCHVSGTVNGNRNTGGLVGWGRRTDFLRCSSSANVAMTNPSGALYHGGLVGHINTSSTVNESFATGNVSGRGRVGGLIGALGWSSQVINCYARGNVQSDVGNPMIGGLIGEVWNAGVRNSYATGYVNMSGVTSDYGGLVGKKATDNHYYDHDNFWDTETSGLTTSEMGTGKITGEMKHDATFTDTNTDGLNNSWDFTSIWAMNASLNDGYPYLSFNLITWTGSFDTDWGKTGNWNPDIIPTAGNSVLIPGLLTNYSVLDQDRTVANLTIASGASLTIPPGTALTANGTITNNAGNTGVLIKSDATGTGSLLHNTDNLPATIERHIPGSPENENYYHLVSVPLTAAANPKAELFTGSHLYAFDVENQEWSHLGPSTETELAVNKGYMIYYPVSEAKIYTFAGAMNNGTVSIPVAYHTTADYEGFNLVPNPYPSALNWDAAGSAWTKTNLANAIYIWNSGYTGDSWEAGYTGNYASYVGGTGANGGSKFIPVGQAFFVRAESANPEPALTITNAARVHSSQPFLKSAAAAEEEVLRIKAFANGYRDEFVWRFHELATPDYDCRYDAVKMYGLAEAPQLYGVTTGQQKLSIYSHPHPTKNISIPLGFELGLDEAVSLAFEGMDGIDNQLGIYLQDLKEGLLIDLRSQTTYAFAHEQGADPERFVLHFGTQAPTGLAPEQLQTGVPYHHIFAANKQLHISIPSLDGHQATVEVFDLLGRRMQQTKVVLGTGLTIDAGGPDGIAIVRVVAGQQVFTQRVMLQ